jgi:hypothetical protein
MQYSYIAVEDTNKQTCEDETDTEVDYDGLVDTERRVAEVMDQLRSNTDIDIVPDSLPTDTLEEQQVSTFMAAGCGCRKALGKPCSNQFSIEYVASFRESCVQLSHSELDMAILGQLSASVNTSKRVSIEAGHKDTEREKSYSSFIHQGKPICKAMFCFIHAIGEKRVKNLTRSLKENGLTARIHGNTKRKPKHAFSFESVEFLVKFIFNYSEQHALLLPGRVPNYKRSDLQLLPSSDTKRSIWRVYREAAEQDGTVHPAAYSSFTFLWRKLVPFIVIMKPRSHLFWQCHQNNTAIIRTANQTESEKTYAIANTEHLHIVTMDSEFHKSICKECKESVQGHFLSDDEFAPPLPDACIPCNSNDIKVHYSFDYAQQVHFPSDPLQPGPIYFLTPRKCSVFGVNCEALPRQINFLTDEAGECGKGANTVVSRIHYFFDHHGLGEKQVCLLTDICSGQNRSTFCDEHSQTGTQMSLSPFFQLTTPSLHQSGISVFSNIFIVVPRLEALPPFAQVVNNSADYNVA